MYNKIDQDSRYHRKENRREISRIQNLETFTHFYLNEFCEKKRVLRSTSAIIEIYFHPNKNNINIFKHSHIY